MGVETQSWDITLADGQPVTYVLRELCHAVWERDFYVLTNRYGNLDEWTAQLELNHFGDTNYRLIQYIDSTLFGIGTRFLRVAPGEGLDDAWDSTKRNFRTWTKDNLIECACAITQTEYVSFPFLYTDKEAFLNWVRQRYVMVNLLRYTAAFDQYSYNMGMPNFHYCLRYVVRKREDGIQTLAAALDTTGLQWGTYHFRYSPDVNVYLDCMKTDYGHGSPNVWLGRISYAEGRIYGTEEVMRRFQLKYLGLTGFNIGLVAQGMYHGPYEFSYEDIPFDSFDYDYAEQTMLEPQQFTVTGRELDISAEDDSIYSLLLMEWHPDTSVEKAEQHIHENPSYQGRPGLLRYSRYGMGIFNADRDNISIVIDISPKLQFYNTGFWEQTT